ncbi:MAG: pantetheine-phosphate adenylyltransferase [Oscillospiraceae bacterium]|nr:pantetheine-phosphate adenylyltransferase [Oscillospiraceae bacterium]
MRTAICPGSFDPVTNGHIDIIQRTCALFDRVYVAVLENYHKPSRLFSAGERVDMLRQCSAKLPNVEVLAYDGLLADLARELKANAVVKGLRAVSDFEIEFQQALTNKQLNPQLETVFMTAESQFMYLSSSVVKQVGLHGGTIGDFVPSEILGAVEDRINSVLRSA